MTDRTSNEYLARQWAYGKTMDQMSETMLLAFARWLDTRAVETSEESDPCVSHLAMKEYEKALTAIRDYPLGTPDLKDSQIWADMLETAREALDGPAEPEQVKTKCDGTESHT